MYYYEVHIFYSRTDGFSRFFKSPNFLEDEDDIINEAVRLKVIDDCDANSCDYAQQLTKEEVETIGADILGDEQENKGFTVAELIEKLQKEDPNATVKIVNDLFDEDYEILNVSQDEDPDSTDNNVIILIR